MLGILGLGPSKSEYSKIRRKLSNLEIKIGNLFKRMLTAMIAVGIIVTTTTVGLVVSSILTAMTLAFAGYPFHNILMKTSLIYGVTMGIAGIYFILTYVLKSYEIIKQHPV